MTMHKNIQNGGGNDSVVNDKLHKKFNNLEQVWDSIKRTNSHRRKHCYHTMDNDVKVPEDEMVGLFDYSSPPSLQQNPKQSEEEKEWNVRTNDLAVLEMLSERKDCMRSGKFKGRSLHDALESASKMGKQEEKEEHIQSGCSSSVLIQESGVQRRLFSSRSSLDSDDDDNHSECSEYDYCNCSEDDYCNCSEDDYWNCSSSSSSLSSVERNRLVDKKKKKKDRVIVDGEWNGDGGKWMAFMGWVAVLLMIFAIGIITSKRYDGCSPSIEYDDFYYPT